MKDKPEMEEYYFLEICHFDFDNPKNWEEVDESLQTHRICDLCYDRKAKFTTYQCAGWYGSGGLGIGGGDIQIDYCNECKAKKKRSRITQTYIDFCNLEKEY
jgi:hypothetical protein